MESAPKDYFLQVVRSDQTPKWSMPEEELSIGREDLGDGWVQYWAYPKINSKVKSQKLKVGEEDGDGFEAENDERLEEEGEEVPLPEAERLAQENSAHKPAILIDEETKEDGEKLVKLVLVKDGHAWAKTESSLANLEDNIFSLIDFAKSEYNLNIEHFFTAPRVSLEVDRKLDEIEKGGVEETGELSNIQPVSSPKSPPLPYKAVPLSSSSHQPPANPFSKLVALLPIILILALFGGVVMMKKGVPSSLPFLTQPTPTPTPTPLPTPTPTPTPSLDRSQYKIRVLNGTTKAGAAKALADKLKEQGWQISATGNAKNQNTPQTRVSVKKGQDEVSNVIISDLGSEYEAVSGAALSASDKADVEVVIGKK